MIEKRIWETAGEEIEVRSPEDGKPPVIAGYAAVFNSLSAPLVGRNGKKFREKIAPGAFTDHLLAKPDIRALWNHNADFPLGRTKNGTLRIAEDHRGVRFEINPPDTSWGRDAVEAIRTGVVDAMSFQFSVDDDQWTPAADGGQIRTLRKAKLYEVSPVTFPAYQSTEVGVRSEADGDMPDVPADEGQAPDAGQADDVVLRAQQERERRLWLLDIHE